MPADKSVAANKVPGSSGRPDGRPDSSGKSKVLTLLGTFIMASITVG